MKRLVYTLDQAPAVAAVASIDAALGMPRKGVHIGDGRHVDVPDVYVPGALGWTASVAVPGPYFDVVLSQADYDIVPSETLALATSITDYTGTPAELATLNPQQIFTGGALGTLALWLRADAATISSGKVTQRTDLSGNGRHEVPVGTSPNPARAPTYVATDARINNRPAVTYQGEAEASANRDATGVTWARDPAGTTARFIARVFCQEGPNLGTNRYPFGDASGSFGVRRASGAGSSVATLNQQGSASTNANSAPVDTVYKRHAVFHSNSLATDYQHWGSVVANGQNAGNVAGTARQTALNPAGNAWAWISVAEEVEVEFPAGGAPTLLQLCQLDAYFADRYGAAMLT